MTNETTKIGIAKENLLHFVFQYTGHYNMYIIVLYNISGAKSEM